jgi:7-keto-8-aminopelargonate synthetase-like enzyme
MSITDKFNFGFVEEDKLVKKINFNPYYQKIESGASLQVTIGNKQYLNLASNNYLALAQNPEITNAMKTALDKYGASMCGTPVACGNADIYEQSASYISSFLGLEDTILYPSCYQANIAVISALVKPNDVVFVDRFAHSSLVEGIRSSGCKIKPYKHNDVSHLKKLIEASTSYKNKFVVTESVFSTEGSIAPFDDIYRLALEKDVIPIIDDSHGIGVIGKTGKGILEEKDIDNFEGIYTASTGKALGINGGFVSSNFQIIEYLRYSAPAHLYSTALAPVLIAGILKSLQIVKNSGKYLVGKLSKNKNYLYNNLLKEGFNLTDSEASICSLITGSNEKTFKITKELFKRNILTTPFIYPSVSKNKGVIRMIPRVDMNNERIDYIVISFIDIRKKYPELF